SRTSGISVLQQRINAELTPATGSHSGPRCLEGFSVRRNNLQTVFSQVAGFRLGSCPKGMSFGVRKRVLLSAKELPKMVEASLLLCKTGWKSCGHNGLTVGERAG